MYPFGSWSVSRSRGLMFGLWYPFGRPGRDWSLPLSLVRPICCKKSLNPTVEHDLVVLTGPRVSFIIRGTNVKDFSVRIFFRSDTLDFVYGLRGQVSTTTSWC